VYYFFFERCRDVILNSKSKVAASHATTQAATIAAGGALTTLESMLAGAIAGSATTIISNPIWVINTRQTVRRSPVNQSAGPSSKPAAPVKKLGFVETIQHVLKTDGVTAFWKGLGPSLVLVINPILQYTAFERLRSAVMDGKIKRGAIPKLSDFEVFLLGALSKLLATGLTYPQIGECQSERTESSC
jgi:adenine nucleotide transporter 17